MVSLKGFKGHLAKLGWVIEHKTKELEGAPFEREESVWWIQAILKITSLTYFHLLIGPTVGIECQQKPMDFTVIEDARVVESTRDFPLR